MGKNVSKNKNSEAQLKFTVLIKIKSVIKVHIPNQLSQLEKIYITISNTANMSNLLNLFIEVNGPESPD